MPIHNADIERIFNEIADLLDLKGENQFRIRAYRTAARSIGSLNWSIEQYVKEGKDLTELPGIGADLAEKIKEIVATGSLAYIEKLHKEVPAGLADLMKIPTIGPRRAKALYDTIGIKNLDDLEAALKANKLEGMHGFGEKTTTKLLDELVRFRQIGQPDLLKLSIAEQLCLPLLDYMRQSRFTLHAEAAGSYRRRKEVIADLDILVATKDPKRTGNHLLAYEEIGELISQGDTLVSVRLRSGVRVDLRMVPEDSFGAALLYFTGSKAHNIALRKIAVKKGLKLNEYGLFHDEKQLAGKTEEQVYRALDLAYIEPELREDRGEVEAAHERSLPKLVALADLRGDLQMHTDATDGKNTLAQMVETARARGYEYVAITDHSQRVFMARGLDEKRLREEIHAIRKLNENLSGFTILASCEVDILEDGTLDLPDSVLRELDFVLGAIHYNFNLPRKKQTDRILRALDNRYLAILAHPTGRKVAARAPYDFDFEKVVAEAKDRGVCMEINSQPERLDLPDTWCRTARDMGMKFAISTDSHAASNLDFIRFGVAQARRGWVRPEDVINTRPIGELKKLLRRG